MELKKIGYWISYTWRGSSIVGENLRTILLLPGPTYLSTQQCSWQNHCISTATCKTATAKVCRNLPFEKQFKAFVSSPLKDSPWHGRQTSTSFFREEGLLPANEAYGILSLTSDTSFITTIKHHCCCDLLFAKPNVYVLETRQFCAAAIFEFSLLVRNYFVCSLFKLSMGLISVQLNSVKTFINTH